MPNRLAAESSPYLLAHAGNPVDWYPWSSEALARAKAEDKPIFLSIGYSACHWCHVMEHESFEHAALARLLNENFVCIKVDREERPDLDQIYMNAVQLMTGRGGWPMSVFLTPDGKPFYGGTYWPPTARGGMPGFDQVLLAVADAWQNRRPQALEQADSLIDHLAQLAAPAATTAPADRQLVDRAVAALARDYDATYGGFGGAPKFPHPLELRLLLNAWHRHARGDVLRMVTHTLDRMAGGGLYDQLGGGFHRYSVDERWLVPHFEKMLYDNALLLPCYLDALLVTGDQRYAQVARQIADYVLREMTDPAGGFYSTQDADSEGVEGKFFVWTPAQLEAVLGPAAAGTFAYVYDVTPEGNFEHGQSILNRPKSLAQCAAVLGRDEQELAQELEAGRAALLAARQQRVPAALDDKVLVAWNGLMIEALAQAAGVLDEPRYLRAAQRAAAFILQHMRRPDGRLWHSWRFGQARLDAYLDDYATLACALVGLYQADFDPRWLDEAAGLMELVQTHFVDEQHGGYYFTADDHEALITRQKDYYDAAVLSGNSMAALALVRLAALSGSDDFRDSAERTLHSAAGVLAQSPRAAAQMLLALEMWLAPPRQIVIVGDPAGDATAQALAGLRQTFLPHKVVALQSPAAAAASPHTAACPLLEPLLAGKQLQGPEPGIFVCEHFACQAPVFGPQAAHETWQQLARRAQPG